ncbi:MAG: dihydroorotase family protein [Nanoarchaeota archaeon]
MSLAIRNGTLVLPDKTEAANILIENGRIAEITKQRIDADDAIDAHGLFVLPGIIDSHVHFREPGQTQKEDFRTGSMAAAAGGVTTILDMPNNRPPILTRKLLEGKRPLAQKSIVNYGFHFGSSPSALDELCPPGIASVKVFFDQSTGDLAITDSAIIEQVFRRSRLITAHAEGGNAKLAADISHNTKTPLSLCHVSSAQEAEVARTSKVLGAEACPHHLLLTEQDAQGPFTLMKPALKTRRDVDALWQAIRDGVITHISSDHAPHTREEKESYNAPSGVPGVETLVPLMLSCVSRRMLTLHDFVRLCSERPAAIFRLEGKGRIGMGAGDLTIVDLKATYRIKAENLHSKCGWTPYEGRAVQGAVTHTIVNGNLIYDRGTINPVRAREVEYHA